MTRKPFQLGLTWALALILVGLAPPPGPRPVRLVLQPSSRVTIEGTSNLHDWSCTASNLQADIQVQLEDDGTAVPVAVDFASIAIPVASIECKNDKMNENLRKALRDRENPTISFRITAPGALRSNGPGRVSSTFRGELRVAGVTKTIDLPVQAIVTPDGKLRISGEKLFLMTQFGIEPPTAMLGMLKTANRLSVRFDLVAAASNLAFTPSNNAAAR